jgi:IstB-like ATP binding protein
MSPQRADDTPAVEPIEISTELKALMCRLKLGQQLDTSRNGSPWHGRTGWCTKTSWRCCWPTKSAAATANPPNSAHLDPQMQLQAWGTAAASFDQELSAELTSLQLLADAYSVLIMGPVGVGKTFLATALGHIAVRRHHSVHTERAHKLFSCRLTLRRQITTLCWLSSKAMWAADHFRIRRIVSTWMISAAAVAANDAGPTAAFKRQWGITVGHGPVPSVSADEGLGVSHPVSSCSG